MTHELTAASREKLPHGFVCRPELAQLVYAADAFSVPHIPQMHALTDMEYEFRPENGEAFTTGMLDAVVHDAIRAPVFQLPAQHLRRDVAVRIVDIRHLSAFTAQVVKRRRHIRKVATHIQLQRILPRSPQKNLAVVTRLGDRGCKAGGCVERAKRSVRETTARRIEMSKRRHDDGATRSERTLLTRHQLDVTYLIPQTRVGQGLDP